MIVFISLSPKPVLVPSGGILNAKFSAQSRLGHPSANIESYVGKHYVSYRNTAVPKSTESETLCDACARGNASLFQRRRLLVVVLSGLH